MTRRLETSGRSPNWLIWGLVGLMLVAIVVVVVAFVAGSGPSASQGTAIPDDGREHVAVGTTPSSRPYSSTPGTSGPHWDTPANWGVYSEPLAESQSIHSLEHGGIVIWYEPEDLSPDQVSELENYVRTQVRSERFKVIVSPWGGEDFGHPIAVAGWQWLLYLDQVDLNAIRSFTDVHYGDAPEPLGGPGPPAG